MMWCVGYLNRSQLMTFLQKAKTRLITSGGPKRRRQLPASFIFVFDNVAKEGEVFEPIKGQLVRQHGELEAIFEEAGLMVHKSSGPHSMPEPYKGVCIWALY